MGDPLTDIGGVAQELPITSQEAMAALREGSGDAGLERLVEQYWKPVYVLIRRSRSITNEDAKDLTQEFFARVVLQGTLAERYVPGRGSFRAYLKGALRNFLAKQFRDGTRQKRGGGATLVPIRTDAADLEPMLPDDEAVPPESAFDLAWRREVVAQATRRMAQADPETYAIFRRYHLDAVDGPVTYERVARDLGLGVDDVKNRLTRAREEFRREVRGVLCESVGSPEDLAAEWEALFGEP